MILVAVVLAFCIHRFYFPKSVDNYYVYQWHYIIVNMIIRYAKSGGYTARTLCQAVEFYDFVPSARMASALWVTNSVEPIADLST